MSGENVAVIVQPAWVVACERCGDLTWLAPKTTRKSAHDLADKHRAAHAARPSCICASVDLPPLFDDDDTPESEWKGKGHKHCRHKGRCCRDFCPCMTTDTAHSNNVPAVSREGAETR